MSNIEKAVAKRMQEYTDAFIKAGITKDHTLLREFSHIPLMDVVKGRAFVVDTEEKSDKRWSRILSNLPDDYDNSISQSIDVTLMSSKSAFVSVDVRRFKKSGEEYDRFWASYIFVKTDENWKISTWIVHDPGLAPQTVRT
jgi:hypothetical protein